jgi:hypothetical protein
MLDIEDQIQKAFQEGKFDQLPGEGKPLHLEDDEFVEPEWRLAYHVLKSSGITLPWIERRQELIQALESARLNLKQTWNWHNNHLVAGQPAAEAEAEWQRAVKLFRQQVAKLNEQIRSYNLGTPTDRFQLSVLDVESEIVSLTSISG